MSLKAVTATAGPKSSSQLIFILGSTSASIEGSIIVPFRSPPVIRRAPPEIDSLIQ